MPRTDEYVGKQKGNGHTILSAYDRSYLFVPTFRESWETPFPDIDWEYIDNMLTDNEIFAIKAHPWQFYQFMNADQVTRKLDITKCKHIKIIPESKPSAPYLYDADVVITDYSSIMFDAYLLNKPVVLFEKNQGYTETRGMYLQYPEQYCSRYAADERGLIDLMRDAYGNGLTPIEISCRDMVAGSCDGCACYRLCQIIDTMNQEVNQ